MFQKPKGWMEVNSVKNICWVAFVNKVVYWTDSPQKLGFNITILNLFYRNSILHYYGSIKDIKCTHLLARDFARGTKREACNSQNKKSFQNGTDKAYFYICVLTNTFTRFIHFPLLFFLFCFLHVFYSEISSH